MIMKRFKAFCSLYDEYHQRKNENIKKLELFTKLKAFIYTIFVFLGFISISSLSIFFSVLDGNLITFKILNVISIVCIGMALLEMTLHLNSVKDLKDLIYTLFNKKKVIEKVKEEKAIEKKIKKEYMKEMEFMTNEENLGAVYSEFDSLTEAEVCVFYHLYQELPEEDLESRVKRRLSIYEKNTINNI